MSRKLTANELASLEEALKSGRSVEEIYGLYGKDTVTKALEETGLRLPGSDAARLGEEERNIYIDTLRNRNNPLEVMAQQGFSSEAVLERLNQAQLYVPLTEAHQGIYDWASENKIGADELSSITGVQKQDIDTVLTAAGLQLKGGKQTGTRTGLTGSDPNYPGGLPRIQDTSGMYGSAPKNQTPGNILGYIPQSPGLRMVRRTAKRENDPNWKGQTDTILTSGRGVTEEANTRVKTLLGS